MAASAAKSTAVRPAVRMLPPATATTINSPNPLDTPPLAYISRAMAAMSPSTCARTCVSKRGRRRAIATLASTEKARYARAV